MPAIPDNSPWYQHRWPWIIIGLLGGAVILTLVMVTIAVTHPDGLVSDHYYEAGVGINRSLDREILAQQLDARATVHIDDLTGEVDLRLSGASHPATLELNLISPTQPEKDRKVALVSSNAPPGRYVGRLDDVVAGRRFVELLGTETGKTWRLFEEEQVHPGKTLMLGDEPIQAAQRQ